MTNRFEFFDREAIATAAEEITKDLQTEMIGKLAVVLRRGADDSGRSIDELGHALKRDLLHAQHVHDGLDVEDDAVSGLWSSDILIGLHGHAQRYESAQRDVLRSDERFADVGEVGLNFLALPAWGLVGDAVQIIESSDQ